jgi:fatty-acyl-CoA synthase
VIIVGGRNVHVAALEHELTASYPGRGAGCAIVDTHRSASPEVVILFAGEDLGESQAASLRHLVSRELGIRVADCVLLPAGSLPRTPSGKLQRHRCRQLARSLSSG